MKGLLQALTRPAIVGSPDRSELRAAIAARDAAKQAVIERRAVLERFEAILSASDVAARAASDAANKARDARQEWVRCGCPFSAGRALEALDAAAAETARIASAAALNADAITKSGELSRAQSAAESAEFDSRSRETRIASEIGAILAREAAPLLSRLEQQAEAYRATRREVQALLMVLAPPWNCGYARDANASSSEGARQVEAALSRATIMPWDKERDAARAHDFVESQHGRDEAMIERLISPWRARAQAVREDEAK